MSTVVTAATGKQYLIAAGGYNGDRDYKDLYVIDIDAGAVNVSKSDVYVPISCMNNIGFAATVANNIVVCVGQPAPDANSDNSKGVCMFQVDDDGSVVDVSENIDIANTLNNPVLWTKSGDNTIIMSYVKNNNTVLYMLSYDSVTRKLTGSDAVVLLSGN